MSNALNFEAAIFDLDGTLLDTLEEIATACNFALEQCGHPVHPVESYRRFVGSGAHTLAMRVLPENLQTEEHREKLFGKILQEFDRIKNTIAAPYEGTFEMLDAFAAAGKKISILSNKPEEFTLIAVDKLLPGVNFFQVRGGRQDTPLKPAPDGAHQLAEAMGVAPDKTIFVGDSDIDMQTACNSGMIPVGASWGFRGADELKNAGAQIVLNTPMELIKLL